MPDIELIARGVVIDNSRILLCSNLRKNNLFLPGGHIEWGESARTALRREVKEEMGLSCKVGRLLGVAEHTFACKGRRVCEINLVFEMSLRSLSSDRTPCSKEKKLRFLWLPLADLPQSKMEPKCLSLVLDDWWGCLSPGPERIVSTSALS